MQIHFLKRICFTNFILLITSLCANSESGVNEGKTIPAGPSIAPPEEPNKIPAEEPLMVFSEKTLMASSEDPLVASADELKVETQYLQGTGEVGAKYKSSDKEDEKTCNVEWNTVSVLPETSFHCWATCLGNCLYYYGTFQRRCRKILYNKVDAYMCDCCKGEFQQLNATCRL